MKAEMVAAFVNTVTPADDPLLAVLLEHSPDKLRKQLEKDLSRPPRTHVSRIC